jgi:hypothetical protein
VGDDSLNIAVAMACVGVLLGATLGATCEAQCTSWRVSHPHWRMAVMLVYVAVLLCCCYAGLSVLL